MSDDMITNWEAFFERHAPHYMQNGFTANTVAEVDFALDLMRITPGSHLLDMGCGVGRHSVELAKRGYRVTGVDLSAPMLAEARKAAQAAGVDVTWIRQDATRFNTAERFDAAICLCEGAFGLVNQGSDPAAHDTAILGNIHACLRSNAPFLLTALNGLRRLREFSQADVDAGVFDPATMIARIEEEMDLPEGRCRVAYTERCWTPPELAGLMRQAGFEVLHLWGGTAGNWARRPLQLDEIEMMLFARKIG